MDWPEIVVGVGAPVIAVVVEVVDTLIGDGVVEDRRATESSRIVEAVEGVSSEVQPLWVGV